MTTKVRLTQEQRKKNMTLRLNRAVTALLAEVGYSRVTAQRIADKADVSQGAIFRHFNNLEDLFINTAEQLSLWLFKNYSIALKKNSSSNTDRFNSELKALQSSMNSKAHSAWIELLVAARTNDTLRASMLPIIQRHTEKNRILARKFIPKKIQDNPLVDATIDTILDLYRGQLINSSLLDKQSKLKLQEQQIQLSNLITLLMTQKNNEKTH